MQALVLNMVSFSLQAMLPTIGRFRSISTQTLVKHPLAILRVFKSTLTGLPMADASDNCKDSINQPNLILTDNH